MGEYLVGCLLVVVLIGWLSGVVVVHGLGVQVMRQVDGPTRAFFAQHESAGWRTAMSWATWAGSDRVAAAVVVLVGLAWRLTRRSWVALQTLVIAYGGGVCISIAVKYVVHRGRPTGLGLVALRGYAYPSGHVVSAVVVFGTLAALASTISRTRQGRVAICAACGFVVAAVAVSRLYLGAHWLTDVVAALGLGACWVWTTVRLVGERGWSDVSSLVAPARMSAATSRRLTTFCLAGIALAMLLTASFLLTPVTRSSSVGVSATCGAPIEQIFEWGPTRRGHTQSSLLRECGRAAEMRFTTAGGFFLANIGLLVAAFRLDRRRLRALGTTRPVEA